MSPFVFWFGFLSLLLMDLIFLDRLQDPMVNDNPMAWLFGSLFLIGTVALPWKYWVRSSALIFARLVALVGVAMFVLTAYAWLSATDVFVVCRAGCPPKVGTFWPLLFVWIATVGFFSFALWPEWESFRRGIVTLSANSLIWYAALLSWTIACGIVFVRNISWDVFAHSFMSVGKIVAYLAAVIAVLVAVGYLATWPSSKKHRRARADFAAIDANTREQFIRRIDEQCRLGQYQLLYRIIDRPLAESDLAKVGGQPLAPIGELWPIDPDGKPGKFLMQMPLLAPRLPAQWHSRILTLYLVDHQPLVRSYDRNTQELHLLASPFAHEDTASALSEIAVPYVGISGDADSEGGA